MELEFLEIDSKNSWNTLFQELRNESNYYSHVIKDAKKLENKNLNRYRDVNPFDHSRVRLQRNEKDYINASLVNVPSANRSYILTQGPLPVTTGHFWLMVWEQKSKAILMLNRVIEKNAVKCHQYWPVGSERGCNDDLILPDVNLKVTFIDQKDEDYYTIRKFLLTDLESNNSREILQFHYTTWPDFGVPVSPSAFLNFLFAVREFGVLSCNVGPPVVHCSAGIGRSGTFCLVDSCLILIEKNNDLNSIDIRQQLLAMRHYRMGLIQTPDQLRFSYLAIIKGSRRVLSDNVPSKNENTSQIYKTINSTENSCSRKDNCPSDLDLLPPPLPARAQLNSDNALVLTRSDSINGVIGKNKFNLDNQQNKLESNANFEQNPQNSNENSILHEDNSMATSTNTSSSSGNSSLSELRKRARKEREKKMATMIQNIKKKQTESEHWDRRRSIIKFSLGIVLIIGLGYFVYKNYSKS